jgi:hypothetical protein
MKIVPGIDRMSHWFKTLTLSVALILSFVQVTVAQSTENNNTLCVATIERKPFAFQQDGV